MNGYFVAGRDIGSNDVFTEIAGQIGLDWDAVTAFLNSDEGAESVRVLERAAGRHLAVYGVGIETRLTGAHETAHFEKFTYGTSDRGASIRIPWGTAKNKYGWIEDRRPNANMDPYQVTAVMVDTVCGDAAGAG